MNRIRKPQIFNSLQEAQLYIKENYTTIKPFLCNYELENTKRQFYIFRTLLDYLKYIEILDKKDRRFNEILQNDIKIFLDIDIKEDIIKENNINDRKMNKLLCIIKEQIRLTFNEIYNIVLLEDNILILKSDYLSKYSYHIVIDGYYVEYLEDVKFFVLHMIEEYFDNMKFILDIIDTQIYSINKSLRLVGNTKYKYKGNYEMYLLNEDVSECRTYLTYIKNCIKLNKIDKKIINIKLYNKLFVERILDFNIEFDFEMSKNTQSKNNMLYKRINLEEELRQCFTTLLHEYKIEVEGYYQNTDKPQFISLDVKLPYDCPICGRQHENSQPYIYISTYSYNCMCFRAKGVIKRPDDRLVLLQFKKEIVDNTEKPNYVKVDKKKIKDNNDEDPKDY